MICLHLMRTRIRFQKFQKIVTKNAVLGIRDVYPWSDFFPSRIRTVSIPDLGSASKNLSILTKKKTKKWFLSSRKYDPGCSSRIRMPMPSKMNIQHFKRWKFCPFFNFLGNFFPSWIQIRNLYADPDPYPTAQINADPDMDPDPKPCRLSTHPGSRVQGSKRHRIPDPDPQHCKNEINPKFKVWFDHLDLL